MLRSTLLQHVRREEADCSLARALFPFVDFIRILTAGLSLEVREYTSNEVAGLREAEGCKMLFKTSTRPSFLLATTRRASKHD